MNLSIKCIQLSKITFRCLVSIKNILPDDSSLFRICNPISCKSESDRVEIAAAT